MTTDGMNCSLSMYDSPVNDLPMSEGAFDLMTSTAGFIGYGACADPEGPDYTGARSVGFLVEGMFVLPAVSELRRGIVMCMDEDDASEYK